MRSLLHIFLQRRLRSSSALRPVLSVPGHGHQHHATTVIVIHSTRHFNVLGHPLVDVGGSRLGSVNAEGKGNLR